jgi:D-amino-acid dehydrogenase
MDAAAIAQLEPNMPADVSGGVFYPRDCHLSPQKLMAWLERELATMGCDFHWESDVEGIDARDGVVAAIRSRNGVIEADEVVLAGGVWSAQLGTHLGLHLPMQAGKGYSLTLPSPRKLPTACAILTEARVAVTPMESTLRFGGTMEMAGANESVTRARVDGIIQSACRYYPDFRPEDFADIEPWHGLRPCAPDGMPYIGRSAKHKNVIVATGHAMMGVSLAPITGKLVGELATGEKPTLDLTLMSPARFA